jgi:DNA helicase-2/ATP-dependent DNA helicase PcrA
LKKTQPEWESRWENVEELINFATEVELDIAKNGAPDLFDFGSQPTEKKGEKRIIYATDSDDEDEVVSTQDEEPSAEAEAQYVVPITLTT